MDNNKLENITIPIVAASFVALRRAAKIARQVAIQTKTAIVIREGSEIVHLSYQMLEKIEQEEIKNIEEQTK